MPPLFQADPLSDPTLGLDPEVNPFVTRVREAARIKSPVVSYGPELADLRGRWREDMQHRMGCLPQQLVLEIGCHKGGVIVPMAKDYPERAFVACDITFKRVMTTAERSQTAACTNIHTIYANAHGIDRVFAPGELDGVITFFPDPWSKKSRQVGRRLISSAFVDRLLTLLKPGAFFWLKTDNPSYYEEVTGFIAGRLQALSAPSELGLKDYLSAYEKKFADARLPTFSQVWVKTTINH